MFQIKTFPAAPAERLGSARTPRSRFLSQTPRQFVHYLLLKTPSHPRLSQCRDHSFPWEVWLVIRSRIPFVCPRAGISHLI